MERIIKIGDQEVTLSNNVAWTMEYRDQFNRDIVPVIMPLLAAATEGISSIISEAGEDLTMEGIAGAVNGRVMDILLPAFQVEFVELVVNVAWAMAKAADETIAPPKKWVRQFDTFPLDVVAPALFDMVMKGFVSSKNLYRLAEMIDDLRALRPSVSMKSSSRGSSAV